MLTGILMIILSSYFEVLIIPYEKKYISKEARGVALKLINEAYNETIDYYNFTYNDFANLNFNNNELESITLNSINVNDFKSCFTTKIQEKLDIENIYSVHLPLGSFTNINQLAGIGPDIELSFRLTGVVDCNIKNVFKSAGVNQTIHNIIFVVNANMNTISADYTNEIDYSTKFEITQTIITGDVPQSYININK